MLLKIFIPPKWAPQARGPLCFLHAAQSIATPLLPSPLSLPFISLFPFAFSPSIWDSTVPPLNAAERSGERCKCIQYATVTEQSNR